ncbi:hypothetical protein ARMSODRAFT_981253 [Armillaria solidipes]|uniref:Uncharacterized protein n=1 Tax=Armillaria solidipes TaxID=1076256 RepID=A0A2H3AVV6_9AGAR|nr:hypothetical protein ARMSODRAFT_981253 [Armillaria solidipes]
MGSDTTQLTGYSLILNMPESGVGACSHPVTRRRFFGPISSGVPGEFLASRHIPCVLDLKRTVSLQAIVRGLGYQDTYAIWVKLKERRSGVAAKRLFKVTLESILGAEEKRGHKPSGSSSGIETPCLVGVPTSNALGSQDRPLYGQL